MAYKRKTASAAYEEFLELCHQKAREAGFAGPSAFRGMRTRDGSWLASVNLMLSGEIQDGLVWARDNDVLAYTVEAAVIKFADEFPAEVAEAAKWRLKMVKEMAKGGKSRTTASR